MPLVVTSKEHQTLGVFHLQICDTCSTSLLLKSLKTLLFFVQVDKIVDQLHQYILSYDIVGLRDFWDYLNDRFFKRLDYQHYSNVKKLEMCLLRLYIIHALQNSKNDKVVEFFEKYTAELQTQTEWREWFGKLLVI